MNLPAFTTLGAGPTVLMLHGIGGGHLAFAPQVAPAIPIVRSLPAAEVTRITFAARRRLTCSLTSGSIESPGTRRASASGCSLLT